MPNLRNTIRGLIRESISERLNLLSENFYLYDASAASDPSHDKGWTLYVPLAEKIVDYLADIERLPRFENRMSMPRIVASGAEGIVVSLDDFKVIKLFHSIDNASKNLGFVSNSHEKTAKVYSKGVINLDKPVVYWKQGSTHNKRNKNYQINRLYYIIMERIIPDRFVFKNIDIELEKFIQTRHTKFNEIIALYNLGGEIKNQIETVYQDILYARYDGLRFLLDYNLNTFQQLIRYINDPKTPPKHVRRIASEVNNLFVTHGKNTGAVLVKTKNGNPLTLKMLFLNALGIVNNFSNITEFNKIFISHLKNLKIRQKKKLAINKNNFLYEDYLDVLNLIDEIILKSGDPEKNIDPLTWRDIHEEQFGRRSDGELVALDIGGKDMNLDMDLAARQFETNISNVRMSEVLSNVSVDSLDPSYTSFDK